MQVLLVKDVPGVGKAGEVKKVADGYARNFILPRKLGVVATPNALKQAAHIRTVEEKHRAQTRSDAQGLADQLDQVRLTFRAKAGENDRLFGSITSGDIAEALEREHQISIDRRRIELDEPIKSLGDHRVAIRIHPEIVAHVTVAVEKE